MDAACRFKCCGIDQLDNAAPARRQDEVSGFLRSEMRSSRQNEQTSNRREDPYHILRSHAITIPCAVLLLAAILLPRPGPRIKLTQLVIKSEKNCGETYSVF